MAFQMQFIGKLPVMAEVFRYSSLIALFDGKGGSIASKVHFCNRPNMGRFGDEIYPFIETILRNGIPKLLQAKNAHLARKNRNHLPDLKTDEAKGL